MTSAIEKKEKTCELSTNHFKMKNKKDTNKLAIHFIFASLIAVFMSTTGCKKIGTPKLTTLNAIEVSATEFESGGTITKNGLGKITERGVCWSKQPNPTIDNNKTDDGGGEGSFTSRITNLEPNTTYFIRAYAGNAKRVSYGNEITIKTAPFRYVLFNGTKIFVFPSDNSSKIPWGPGNINTGANSSSNGQLNTTTLQSLPGSYASKTCSELNTFGYSDWYLPSKDELNAIYQNKTILTGFESDIYWSSTEKDSFNAFAQHLGSGEQGFDIKGREYACRCVRKD
jgi:hypothetical protein